VTASVVDQFCDNQARMPVAPGVELDRIVVGQEQINSAAAELRDVALRPTKTVISVSAFAPTVVLRRIALRNSVAISMGAPLMRLRNT
jgi:hypothetical protein